MEDEQVVATPPGFTAALEKALNRHGYAFQYSVIKRVQTLRAERHTPWSFEVAEFPVAALGESTRLDFILKSDSGGFFILAECKRANPALSNWCFFKAPYVGRGLSGKQLV